MARAIARWPVVKCRRALAAIIAICNISAQMKDIVFTAAATRQWERLDVVIRRRVKDKLNRYAQTGAGDVTALTGQPGARLRVGDWRVIFVETETSISVRAVGHRSKIYGR